LPGRASEGAVLDSGVVGMPDRALHRSENWRLSILYMHTKNTKHTQQTEQQQKGGGVGAMDVCAWLLYWMGGFSL